MRIRGVKDGIGVASLSVGLLNLLRAILFSIAIFRKAVNHSLTGR